MTKEEKNKVLENAWKKICEYVRDNFNDVFPEGFKTRWSHDVYYWIEFVVSPQGEARIYRGTHDTSYPSEVITACGAYNVYSMSCKPDTTELSISTNPGTRPMGVDRKCLNIEIVIKGWNQIKNIINEKKEYELKLKSFEADDKVDYFEKISNIQKEILRKIYHLLPKEGQTRLCITEEEQDDGEFDIYVLWADKNSEWHETKVIAAGRCGGNTEDFYIIVESSFDDCTERFASCDNEFCFEHIDWLIQIYNRLYLLNKQSVKS